jgi:hypothetical protein
MSNFAKKMVSAVSGLAIVFSIVSPIAGTNAVYSNTEAANKLASLGIINDNMNDPSSYRLNDTISREEMAKITMKMS